MNWVLMSAAYGHSGKGRVGSDASVGASSTDWAWFELWKSHAAVRALDPASMWGAHRLCWNTLWQSVSSSWKSWQTATGPLIQRVKVHREPMTINWNYTARNGKMKLMFKRAINCHNFMINQIKSSSFQTFKTWLNAFHYKNCRSTWS